MACPDIGNPTWNFAHSISENASGVVPSRLQACPVQL